MNFCKRVVKMDNNRELTNVPDYQKIIQTSGGQGPAGEHNAEWSEDVETLTPSPVVRQPSLQPGTNTHQLMPQRHQHQFGSYSHGTWEEKQAGQSNPSPAAGKASWEAQPQPYSASRYGGVAISQTMPTFKEVSFVPQGFSRPVTKYIDANGVERRILRRNMSPNRRSFTEGFMTGDAGLYREGALRSASSQKNIDEDYAVSPSLFNSKDGEGFREVHMERASRSVFTKGNYTSSNVGYPIQPAAKGDDQWKEIGEHLKTPQEDLRHWQQQHQEQLLHQHLETQALYETPNNQPHPHLHNVDTSFSKLNLQEEPPARWEPVRRAADNIIREKNMIIDKLKNRILELEEDFKVSESKLRKALISKEDDADIVQEKLQEMQHKNANLKERLNEERVKKNSEIDDLELKLGSAEHELQQIKEILRNKDLGVMDMQNKLEEKSREAEAWREKFDESRNGHHDMKKKLDSLQRYLDELPTVEESRIRAQQMLSLREEKIALKNKSENLEKKLSQVRKVITARDFRIRELEEKEHEFEKKLSEARDEVERLRDSEGSEFYKTQRELNTVKADRERLAIDLEKAKKLLETTHLKMRAMEVKCQGEQEAAQERVTQEEEAVVSLRSEIIAKEDQMERMKKSMKELGVRNQELLEQSLMVREQVRHMEATSTNANVGLHRRFMLQLSLCFSELRTLVQICSQQARGEDPDISALLGVKNAESEDSLGDGATGGSVDSNQTMTQWLTQLGDLRKEVDRLRAHICNKYAEDMGDNINCATQ